MNSATIKQWPVETLIEQCARSGVPSVTLWHEDVDRVGTKAISRLLSSTGLVLNGYCRAGFFSAATHDERMQARERNMRVLENAAALNSSCVAIVAGGLAKTGARATNIQAV